ncbi:MAG: AI-2E family transporter [Terriglobales bacterium]
MPLFDARTGRVLLTILVVAAVLAFIYAAGHILIAFLFSIFFAYLIDPLVCYAEPRVHTRGRAIAVVYVGFAIALALLGFLLGQRLAREAEHLAKTLPEMFQKFASGQIAWTIGSQHGWSYETQLRLERFLASHQQEMLDWAKRFAQHLAGLAKSAWWLVLVPILGVFFLKDGRGFADDIVGLVKSRRQQEFVDAVLGDIHIMLAHFIRAQLILAVLSGVVYTGALLVMRVPYAVALGAIGGALEFIPVVGPFVAALLILFVALATGYNHILLVLAFLGVWRIVQDYVNAPRIMGRHTELHPLLALFAVLSGAEIGGVVGVYLSIPIIASLRIVWRHWRAYMESPRPSDDEIIIPPSEVA